ncbi:uncharacterized protein METZ01_LOCUS436622, partial [marine metagenome]
MANILKNSDIININYKQMKTQGGVMKSNITKMVTMCMCMMVVGFGIDKQVLTPEQLLLTPEQLLNLTNADKTKIEYYNQLHADHAANFDGPELWSEITVAPTDGSRDGTVSANICGDSWSSETWWILLDTANWWAWGANGWTQHTAGAWGCEDWSASVPAGNYLFILADSWGDGGGTADVSVNGDYVG